MSSRLLSLVVYEWILLRRDRRAAGALIVLAVLLVAAFVVNAAALARDNAAKTQTAAAERARWLAQPAKDPHSAAHYSIYAFKPVPALAALDFGVEPFVGQAVWLEAHVQNDLLYRPQGDASALDRAGLRHPAVLLATLAPLVAFLLAFATAARERERGTLRLALGVADSPRRLAFAKAAAVWLALVAALVLPLVLAAAADRSVTGTWHADVLARLAAWTCAAAIYLAVFAVAGVAIALYARDTRLALIALCGVWAAVVLALPRFTSTAADAARPLPSTQSVKQQLFDEAPSYWSAETSRENEAAILAQAGVSRREELRANYRGLELDRAERYSQAVFDRVLGGFHDRVIAQDEAFGALAWLSPAIAFAALSPALAGTDFAHHRRFIDAAERYRRQLVNTMNAEVAAHRPGADGKAHAAGPELWASQPAFVHEPPRLGEAGSAGPAFAALTLWLLAASLLLARVARRLQP
ncbi:MAG TPA: DUF3526 domain-containing protein [Tahibacter sp.]|uniref:DUF3526 domain-containing protein n=1 Tax=Tahibacter sp. TaxID=2056211 RepID=UPI002C7AE956|nr:DUF3526 domain-containing protein [Tahibacter sp.]HSX59810.1 DUF3526 domain-containing protein [Tahibacter sp.]